MPFSYRQQRWALYEVLGACTFSDSNCSDPAAVFPLQVLGYDVDAINTVHFSNHAGEFLSRQV